MKPQFTLAGCQVDLSRNQISRDGQSETLPPKAMAVLACLVEQQGQVISQDLLLDTVWAGSVVSPNTLQRSITQLRKALGDDSKSQSIIQTHAKRGYSLEVPVQWQTGSSDTSKPAEKPSNKKTNQLLAVLGGLLAVVILGFTTDNSSPTQAGFTKLVSITASDAKEGGAGYSPDGRYIVFHRFEGLCSNHVWAKDLASGREIQLTSQQGVYNSHTFSPDGKQLLFKARETCSDQPNPNKVCWDLMTLNFEAALTAPQQPSLRISCEQAQIADPKWLSDGKIAVLQRRSSRWQLVSYQVGAMHSETLYAPENKHLYAIDHSTIHNRIAVLALNEQGHHLLEMLDSTGQLLASNIIDHQAPFARLEQMTISFSPVHPNLLFSAGKQVYSLSFDGEVKLLEHLVNQQLFEPRIHPGGEKLVAISGIFDRDIAKVSLTAAIRSQAKPGFNQVSTPYPSLDRSIFEDKDAHFQPGGDLVAYVSERSGSYQIWLNDGKASKQLSRFAPDSLINGLAWHSDGQRLSVAANGQLYQISIAGEQKPIAFKHPVLNLFQQQTDGRLLISTNIAGQPRLISLNGETGKYQEHAAIEVNDAKMLDSGELIYLDLDKTYWRKSADPAETIAALRTIKSAKRFALSNNKIYSIGNRTLWSYDLSSDIFETHQAIDPYVDYVSDIKGQQMLITQVVSVKKEVVELRK